MAFGIKLLIWYVSMTLYFVLMILLLCKIGFWEIRLLKGTIIWFLATGIILSARAVIKAKDNTFFINVLKDNITVFVVFQFIVNLYSFPLFWEIVMVFLVGLISLFIPILERDQSESYLGILKFLKGLLGLIGLLIIINSLRLIIVNLHKLFIIDSLKDLFLPSLLSIMFLPYAYLFAVWAAYEVLFMRLGFKKTIDDKYRRKLYFRIVLLCNLNLIGINDFIKRSDIMHNYVKSKKDISKIMQNYKSNKRVNDVV